ncbi:MAG: Uma2 family endonuclease [Bacteroidota bacterium]
MTATISQKRTATTQNQSFEWTIERYHRAIEKGVFTEDDRIELLDGKIIEKMSVSNLHSSCVMILMEHFPFLLGRTYQYRSENPIILNDNSELEPDFVIVRRSSNNYREGHPKVEDIHLLVEVADESLNRDRTYKAKLYASANIAEYWIINLANRQIEVHTKPSADTAVFGSVQHFKEEEEFESPFVGEVVVKELLP